jgi:hypothetical protein
MKPVPPSLRASTDAYDPSALKLGNQRARCVLRDDAIAVIKSTKVDDRVGRGPG